MSYISIKEKEIKVSGLDLNAGKPGFVFSVFAFYDIEESGLQLLCNRSCLAFADGPVVEFSNGCHFSRGAGEKSFVADVYLVAGESLLRYRNSEVACKS